MFRTLIEWEIRGGRQQVFEDAQESDATDGLDEVAIDSGVA